MNVLCRRMVLVVLALTLVACGEERGEARRSTGSDTLTVQHDQAELSRIAVQEDAVGTAYGNILKLEQLIENGELIQAKKLATETRDLLLAYVDSVEESQLPRLEERAKNAIYDLDRVLYYLDSGETEKARKHIKLCKIHLDSLRELTGLKRMM